MAGKPAKGTVTAVGSVFPADEAQKAARLVQDAIPDRQNDLRRVQGFIADNSALIKLVRDLPDELSHEVMVPLGSAAFFPGRLIHTNEFLVLLGDGYYAERSAKQTAEILIRRGKALEAQVDSLKATVLDLEAKARFFDSTAADAAEGIMEIREEYIEEPNSSNSESGVSVSNPLSPLKADNSIFPDKLEEDARIMARLNELEREELEAGSASGTDEDEGTEAGFSFSKSTDYDDYGDDVDDDDDDDESETSAKRMPKDLVPNSRGQEMFHSKPTGSDSHQHLADKSSDSSSDNIGSQPNKMAFSGQKAFTGSVIERTYGLPSNQSTKSSASDHPSKPISRFKMQRGKH